VATTERIRRLVERRNAIANPDNAFPCLSDHTVLLFPCAGGAPSEITAEKDKYVAFFPIKRLGPAVGPLAIAIAAGVASLAVPIAAAAPAKAAARAAVAQAPRATASLISLNVTGVPAAGIPAFAGTYGNAAAGPGAGEVSGATFPDPDGVLRYITAATHTNFSRVVPATPGVPGSFAIATARGDLVHIEGPSLVSGGQKLVYIPELHTYTQCNPPHGLFTDSHVTPQVLALGHVLPPDGPAVHADATGAQLGLPDVQSAALTFTMRTILNRVGVTNSSIFSEITIAGTLTGRDGSALYSGTLLTLRLADVTADCSEAPVKADVQITKSGPATVHPDGTVTYTLDVVNHGPGSAGDVTVQDPVSDHLTDVRGLTSGCSVTGTTERVVECTLGTLAADAVRKITFTATAKPGTSDGTGIGNCGTVYTTTPETSEANNQSCLTTAVEAPPPTPQTDISVVKTGSAAAVLPGGTVSYTVTVTNDSKTDAHDVVLGDVPGVLGTLASAPTGCTDTGNRLTCSIGILPAGHTRTFTVTETAAADATAGEALTNCAAADTSTPETDENNNQSCVSTAIESPTAPPPPPPARTDLAVAKSAPSETTLGHAVRYELTVTNNSDVDAGNVVLNDVFGEFMGLPSAPRVCALHDHVLTCDIGPLGAGESRTIVFTAIPAAGAAPGDSMQNCEDAQTVTPETALDNNASCTATLITSTQEPPQADVGIAKSGPTQVKPGGSVSYRLTVTNHSATDATDVVVSDVIADELATVTGMPAGCSLGGRLLTCDIGTLAGHTTRTFTITGMAGDDLADGTVVENCGVVYADLANAASCASTTVESRVIPVGPPPTGGGLTPPRSAGTLLAGGWLLLTGGILVGVLGLRGRRRATAAGDTV
jgi:uncharacterized repeat protein (TIGR01451 family)